MQFCYDHAATTAIYTIASPHYRARHLEQVLAETLHRSVGGRDDAQGRGEGQQ